MSEVLERVGLLAAVQELHRVLDVLQAADPADLTDEASVGVLREFERARRRLEPVEHALILDVERRGVPARAGARTTGLWLRQALTIDVYEANARVRAAQAAGPRRSLLGEPLPPVHPVVAAAQTAGELGAKQARVITNMLDTLPAAVCEQVPGVEARLVRFARVFDAAELAKLAARERAHLDPDGGYREVERRRREREFRLTTRPDGSCTGSFAGTAELGEFLHVVFDSLGAPKPAAADGVPDPRTARQRHHDAVLDALKVAVGSGSLPSAGGMLATVILTMPEQTYRTGEGFASTGHGAQVPVREAMSWAGGDYRLFTTVLTSVREIIAYSTCHRLFTENERLAMTARDAGCCFPGCTAPPGWTQAHHITEWQETKRTSVDDGCLLCGYHHREFGRLGWTVRMADGRPQWTPPRTIDPDQKPIRV